MNCLMKRNIWKNSTSEFQLITITSITSFYDRFGNYEIMEKLYQYIPEAVEGKAHVDHIIDLCGTPKEGGTGLQNLRECIVWTEEKFNFEPKLKKVTEKLKDLKFNFYFQPFWKQMSKNFIERYCYLIVFATYLRERAPR